MVDSDGEVGFVGGLTGHWCGFRHQLQLLMEASPASAKSAVCQIRAGWIEAEELIDDDLDLVLGERWFHVLNDVYVGQPREKDGVGQLMIFWWIWKAA